MINEKYLLDTCIISYFLKEDANVIKHLKKHDPAELCVSIITILEIEYGFGLNNSRRLVSLYQKWKEFMGLVVHIHFNDKTAIIASDIKKHLKQNGLMIGAYDILIAATALEHNLICVTNNIGEFSRISNLQIEDWKK